MNQILAKPKACADFIINILTKLDVAPEIARRWAELLVHTSLISYDSHGIRMLERYIEHIESGGVHIHAQPEIVQQTGSCVCLDAKGGLGHIAADDATALALEQAKANGISCVAARNCNHVGACGLYVRKVALQDCIGICTTVSRAGMAPWGGREPLLGSNPIAISAPADGMAPFLFDVASSVVSMGKITFAKDLGLDIPSNWALDQHGWPTTNPAAAITGTLLPFGGHKGYGLAMAVEILSAFLAGGIPSHDVKSWINQKEEPIEASFTIIVIDINAFRDARGFRQMVKAWLCRLTNSPTRDGFEKIFYPGQREGDIFLQRSEEGIPLCHKDVEMMERLASKYEVDKLQTK